MATAIPEHDHRDPRGDGARRVRDIPLRGWKDIAFRVKDEVHDDRLTMVAAGVAFYGFLALFPALAAVISIWGLVADPAQAQQHISALSAALPASARALLDQAAARVAASSSTALGWSFALSLLLTLWSANKGVKGLLEAVNIAYDERDERGFFATNALSLALTFGAILMAVGAIATVVVVPPLLETLGLSGVGVIALRLGRWLLLGLMMVAALAVLFRVSPPRENPEWRWVTPGSIIATILWLIASFAFSFYTANFGSYNATYGSVAAVAIMLMWFFISAFIVLLGAEWNAETERQTGSHPASAAREPSS